jgi:hypothetical protein
MRIFNFLIFIFIISLISCKKDNDYPIIEPGSYFPVYPDSFWKYLVNDSIIIMDSTNDSYYLHHFPLMDTYDEYTEFTYVPYYNSSDLSPLGYTGAVYKYGRYTYNALTPAQIWPFLSETIGYSFSEEPVSQYPFENELFTVKAKVFNGQDSVLIIVGTYFVNNYPQFTSSRKRYREFIKGVGLAKDIVYDTITSDTISKKILVDYYISHKKEL